MNPTKYTFSIAALPKGKVDSQALTAQLAASTITIAVDHIDTGGDVLDVWFKDELPSAETAVLNAVVAIHDGEPPLSSLRQNVKIQVYTKPGANLVVKGARKECDLGAVVNGAVVPGTTNLDLVFTETREIQGARADFKDWTDGDFVEFFLAHPQAGNLHKWADTLFIPPNGHICIDTDDAKTIPAGLILRAIYTAVASSGPKPMMYLSVRTWK